MQLRSRYVQNCEPPKPANSTVWFSVTESQLPNHDTRSHHVARTNHGAWIHHGVRTHDGVYGQITVHVQITVYTYTSRCIHIHHGTHHEIGVGTSELPCLAGREAFTKEKSLLLPNAYLTEGVYKIVLQKSIPAQIRESILCYY